MRTRQGICPTCNKPARLEAAMSHDHYLHVVAHHAKSQHVADFKHPLTVKRLADLCGVRPITIYTAVRRGLLRPLDDPNMYKCFDIADVAEYFNRADRRVRAPHGQ